jgi:DNA-binding transcriptional LysR family regulator
MDMAAMIASEHLVKKIENVKPSFVVVNDLNNIRFFAKIVEQGSLTAASESLGVAKSMLSQHLKDLEKELGVPLIKRTSRRLQVTEVGKRYYAQCLVILDEVARASGIADQVRNMPRGKLRMSCPLNLAQAFLAPILMAFLRKYPDVEVTMDVTNRTAASTTHAYDFMLHIGPGLKASAQVRASFSLDREILVASPALLMRAGTPQTPAELKSLPSAAGHLQPDPGGRYFWHLSGATGGRQSVQHFPRLLAEDLWVIRECALAGCVLASLPTLVIRNDLEEGRLVRVLPEWKLPEQKLHVIYQSRQGLTLAARTLIDFIVGHVRTELRKLQDGTLEVQARPSGMQRGA